jgi:antitoxin ParD1/3/4
MEAKAMQNVEKLSITLPREMARIIREKVAAGEYASNSEVIREALRLLQAEETVKAEKLAALRHKINRSIEEGGPSLDASEVFERLKGRRRSATVRR